MDQNSSARGNWGSKVGFILAAAGSAVGLGNIWLFPTVAGQHGGAAFVLVYLLCVLLIGVPVMIAEISIGRRSVSDAVGAFKVLAPGTSWKLVGGLGVFTGFMILSAYCVVAGWTLKYIQFTLGGYFTGADVESVRNTFNSFVADGPSVVFFHLVFIGITSWIVTGGVETGIEKASKILMPLLLLILLLLVARSVTLPGAARGLVFYLKPDLGKVTFQVAMAAMGQAFFSLSLGMGAMITYGSYLSKKDNIVSSAVWVSMADTSIAFLAGFAIFPALFSVPGLTPQAGAGLIFQVLPNIFNAIPMGALFGAAFFFLLAIAALTSTISLLEVVVAYFIDQRGWSRRKAALSIGGGAFLLGIPSALSNGAVPWLAGFMGQIFFIFGQLSLTVGAFFICIFAGWKWGARDASNEIRMGNPRFALAPFWSVLVRFVCPLAVAFILIQQLRTLFS